jgi:peptide/nickel transport system substrate-binding protein
MHFNAWLSRRARRDGWGIYLSNLYSAQQMDPVVTPLLSGACEKALSGWPCDPELEHLREAFVRADDQMERKSLAEQVQIRAMEIGALVPLGEYIAYVAARKSVTGYVPGLGGLVFWNVEKN